MVNFDTIFTHVKREKFRKNNSHFYKGKIFENNFVFDISISNFHILDNKEACAVGIFADNVLNPRFNICFLDVNFIRSRFSLKKHSFN